MEYFECDVPQGIGLCSDNSCPCPEVEIPRENGYLYIEQDLVDFRRQYPSLQSARKAMQERHQQMNENGGMGSVFYRLGPILVCEQGAKLRKLDLEVAAADAVHWWKTGQVPLRPTPKLESRRFTGATVKEAKAAAIKKLAESKISRIEVIPEDRPDYILASDDTQEGAIQLAMKYVPPEAIEVKEPRVTQTGESGFLNLNKWDEKEARKALRGLIPQGAEISTLECLFPPKKGFMGLGKKMGQWKAKWTIPFEVKVTFKRPAVIEVFIKKDNQV